MPRRLAVTLQALGPLPQSFAQAKRIDPLTRLEADLLSVAPFMGEYREIHSRCVSHPERLSSFLAQTQIMKQIVEEQKYGGMTCRRTDLHETRDVVYRQFLRLFDAALEGELKARRIATAVPSLKQVIRHSCKHSDISLSCSVSPSILDEDRTLSKISAILPFSLPLSRRRRNFVEVPPEVHLASDRLDEYSEDTKWKVAEEGERQAGIEIRLW